MKIRRSNCTWQTAVGISFLIAVLLCAAGGGLLSTGLNHIAEVESLDAASDFQDLGTACFITQVFHTTKEWSSKSGRSSRTWNCKDMYWYEFTVGNSSQGELYLSRKEEKTRSKGRCSSTSKVAATFSDGQNVQCWQPLVNDISWAYHCGDDSCFKIFSPQEELNLAYSNGRLMFIIGAVLLPVAGVAGVVLCIFLCFYLKKKRQEVSPDVNKN